MAWLTRHERDKQIAQRWLQSIGKCGSASPSEQLCTLHSNHFPTNHQAQIMSGVDDGKVLAEWEW